MNHPAAMRNIMIIGIGPLGLEVARQLQSKGERVTLADNDEARVGRANEEGLRAVLVDYMDDQALREIGIGSTAIDVIFSLQETDAENVFIVITVRAITADTPLIAIAESDESAQRLLAAGASKVIDPYKITGRKIHELIRRPLVAEILEHAVFGRNDLSIAEIEIAPGSSIDGSYLHELNLSADYNLIVLGVVDQEYGSSLIFATSTERHKLDPGDVLVVIGDLADVERLRNRVAMTG